MVTLAWHAEIGMHVRQFPTPMAKTAENKLRTDAATKDDFVPLKELYNDVWRVHSAPSE